MATSIKECTNLAKTTSQPTTFLALVYQIKIKRITRLLVSNRNLHFITKSFVRKVFFWRNFKNNIKDLSQTGTKYSALKPWFLFFFILFMGGANSQSIGTLVNYRFALWAIMFLSQVPLSMVLFIHLCARHMVKSGHVKGEKSYDVATVLALASNLSKVTENFLQVRSI